MQAQGIIAGGFYIERGRGGNGGDGCSLDDRRWSGSYRGYRFHWHHLDALVSGHRVDVFIPTEREGAKDRAGRRSSGGGGGFLLS